MKLHYGHRRMIILQLIIVTSIPKAYVYSPLTPLCRLQRARAPALGEQPDRRERPADCPTLAVPQFSNLDLDSA